MSDSPYAPLAALLHEIRDQGAITVRTPHGEGPLLAVETTIHLGGSTIVKIHPDLTRDDARWQEHQRAVEERMEPLRVLRSWTNTVQRVVVAARRVIALATAVAMIVGWRSATTPQRAAAWLLIPPAVGLLLRYAVRPLTTRLVTWGLRRALGAAPV
jgi:hypothetical protein